MHRIPTTKEVVPGAAVNIVLKADQPTGRTVQGVVGQLLTRGNHPRGIKVRLTDGRVGRVQSMAGAAVPSTAQIQSEGSAVMPAETTAAGPTYGGRRRRRGGHSLDGDEEQPSSTRAVGLDAYIKPAKQRGGARNAGSAARSVTREAGMEGRMIGASAEEEESTCPVCGEFRGDVAAVTHHVESHFQTGPAIGR
ncbi:uncharacterized protein B0T15DRAFT_401570 [Chaetomium strumarium]|uniref:UBZ4-type domain-containing protein n=1 Tax=Chaetomium strumarium TaxID=1170767 RepID=A0AAJ0GMS4_9PEZI|nr:hypothetical protein B0T15DRAFT_401570 [Chaetomium strumarium]